MRLVYFSQKYIANFVTVSAFSPSVFLITTGHWLWDMAKSMAWLVYLRACNALY